MADMNFGVHVLPKTTTTYNLGSTNKKWNNIYGTLKGNADTATKLGTSTIGSTNRGIYLNSGTPTALTWYPNYCTITSGNQGNYPWHRFATMTTGTSINIDRTVIVILHGRYNGGPYGIIKLSTRVNSSGSNINIKAVWLLRDGFSPDDVKIAKTGNSSGTNTTIDAYIHRGAWSRTIGYIMEGSNLGWSLINSNEVYDTTTSDKLDSVEVYTDINRVNYNEIVTAVDGGRVNWANGTDYATNVRVTETNPTSATKYYPNFTTGITANTNYVLRGTPHYYLYDAGTAATGVYLNIGAANYKGGLTLHTNSSYYGDIAPTTLTANRTYTLPDASGTVALTSNLSAYVLKAGDTMTGTLKLVSGSGVYAEGNSLFYWLSGSTSSYQKQAAIFTTTSTVNSKKVCERFYFREYSHNSSTGAAIEEWDQYRLPVVTADKTSADTYEILTSKSAVTIAQGGTGATTAAGARTNLGLGSLATKNGLAWNEITQSGADSLPDGNSDFTDNTELLTSYASNNGFADTNALGKVYKRDAICMYNYVKTKASGTWGISISGNAATATKATQDSSGNTITSKYVTVDTAQNITGLKTFKSLIQAYRYSVDTAAHSLPFMTFDKPGSNATGIGPDGTNNRIHFGPCPLDGSSWVSTSTFNNNEWHFQGYLTTTNTLAVPAGIWQKVELIHADSNAQSAGWYRTCVVSAQHNYADFLLSLTGGWNNGAPNVALLHICMRNGQANIATLHGGFTGRITQVRLVKNATNTAYLDLYLSAMSSATAALYGNFLGNVAVSNVATTNTITTSTENVLDTVNLSSYNFQINGTGKFTSVYGAVWNDYAEYRKDNPNENQEPGRCIKELGDGSLALTTKRLERGCEIVSDTFGFAIGQDEKNGYNTPIASNGRVLAYPYESIEEFRTHIGWPVCSGPNGTVSIMTEEEEEKYPSRIIGTISEIPNYEEWGTGKVKIDGRIWIRIR